MTTAARPTWHPAVGGHSLRDTGAAPTHVLSSRDLASQTKLKLRQPGQNAPEDLDELRMKERLEKKEREHFEKTRGEKRRDVSTLEEESAKRPRIEDKMDIDADDSDADESDSEEESDSDDDDEDDDEAELLRELEKIRKERAEEKERQERERMEEEERKREDEALIGNPLLQVATRDFSVKRRWDDDVVFKNQAKGVDETPKKRFINDLLRSDFHRKFMSKYVK